MSRKTVTLFENHPGEDVPSITTLCSSVRWNGYEVPYLTTAEFADYFRLAAAVDPNGEWWTTPFVDSTGTLRLPT